MGKSKSRVAGSGTAFYSPNSPQGTKLSGTHTGLAAQSGNLTGAWLQCSPSNWASLCPKCWAEIPGDSVWRVREKRGEGETKDMLLYLPHFPKGNQVGCRVNTQCFLRKLDILGPCLGFSFGRPVRLGVSQQAKCSRRTLALIWLRCPNGSQLWAKPVCILYEAILIFLFMLVLKWFTLTRNCTLTFNIFL